ncbi:MAG: hypothetical protein ACSLFE_01290 [Gemmatimonadaceae bacterium]
MQASSRIFLRDRRLQRPALLAAAAALLSLSACGESSVTDPYQGAAGVFLLQSIAGQPLPAVITSSSTEGEVRVTTGSLFLSADRRFQETLTVTLQPPGTSTPQNGSAVASGTYTVVGDSVEFSIDASGSTAASTMQATLRGDTLSYSVLGRVVLYLKL